MPTRVHEKDETANSTMDTRVLSAKPLNVQEIAYSFLLLGGKSDKICACKQLARGSAANYRYLSARNRRYKTYTSRYQLLRNDGDVEGDVDLDCRVIQIKTALLLWDSVSSKTAHCLSLKYVIYLPMYSPTYLPTCLITTNLVKNKYITTANYLATQIKAI